MKKVFLSIFAASAILLGSGCLKDKGFDDNKYGLNGVDNSPKGVGFPESSKKVNYRALISTTTPATVQMVQINLNSAAAATEDVHVNIVANPTLVANFNADPANTPKLNPLPTSLYTSQSFKVTILKGSNIGTVSITIPNPSLIDASKNYGFGYTIASVDEAGYTIADNQKDMLVAINIKNQYDGDYLATGYFFHPSSPRGYTDRAKTVSTVGPITSSTELGDLGGLNYFYNFDVIAGNVVSNFGIAGSAAPPPPSSGFFTADNPGGVVYSPTVPGVGQWVQTTYNNTYNPTTKTFFLHYGYGVGSTNQNGWTRNVYERLVRQ
jgi:Domain of unknown function (DUF1735)